MRKKTLLIWDLGGTKCAAALMELDLASGQFECVKRDCVRLREFESLHQLAKAIENNLNVTMAHVDGVCIGGAGQFDGTHLNLQNGYPYEMPFAEVAAQQGWPSWEITHDYVPIVCATFTSYMHNQNNIRMINEAPVDPLGRRVAFGVGTGLGLKDGVRLPSGEFWLGSNEIGHIGITCPPTATRDDVKRHNEFMRFLRSEKSLLNGRPLTFEEVLSGRGTTQIHQFLTGQNDISPEALCEQLRAGWAQDTLGLFAWYLGLFINALQLIFMPSGGIWMTGGVIVRHLEMFDQPDFTRALDTAPAYHNLRQTFPIGVLTNYEHAFYGGAFYAANQRETS